MVEVETRHCDKDPVNCWPDIPVPTVRRYAESEQELVYSDDATRSVRRTLIADETPKDFFIHSTSITVDYDYVAINAHDYLMPSRGSVSLRQGKREAVLNEIEFRDYRRFGSKSRILGYSQTTKEN